MTFDDRFRPVSLTMEQSMTVNFGFFSFEPMVDDCDYPLIIVFLDCAVFLLVKAFGLHLVLFFFIIAFGELLHSSSASESDELLLLSSLLDNEL